MIGNTKKIEELIKRGFDLEAISFEFGIPLQQLEQYKRDIEASTSKNFSPISKMERVRQRYNKLFYGDDKKEPVAELSEQDIELINAVISQIEAKVQQLESATKEQRRQIAHYIILNYRKIQNKQLTVEQAEKLYGLVDNEKLKKLNTTERDKTNYHMVSVKGQVVMNLVKAIEIKSKQTEDIDELRNLRAKLTLKMRIENPAIVPVATSMLEQRITEIQKKSIYDYDIYKIPINIFSVVLDLANGTVDIEQADKILEEEARKNGANRPKTKFAITPEQERKMLEMQIERCLIDQADIYDIKEPQTTVAQLMDLFKMPLDKAVRIAALNLVNREMFQEARMLYNRFYKPSQQISQTIRTLRKEIRNAEIRKMVLRGINMSGTREEENRYFESIQNILESEDIKLSSILLGKNKDGSKQIRLSDVWEDQKGMNRQ